MSAEVRSALAAGEPVVALESAVITHGLPRTPTEHVPDSLRSSWSTATPTNLELARQMQHAVRGEGATPATIAVIDGVLTIGLDDEQLIRLAADENAVKVSSRDLAPAMAANANAGTTVAATLIGCTRATPNPIRIFATGGIGGVHRHWTKQPDISNDLTQLAREQVCIICAGAKSILDIPATLEALETLGVPVFGLRTDRFPRFVCPPDPEQPLAHTIATESDLARRCRLHWNDLGLPSAVLAVQSVDPAVAVDPAVYADAVQEAEWEADRAAARGAMRTPFLLDQIARLTRGAALRANLDLLVANARSAARTAIALAGND